MPTDRIAPRYGRCTPRADVEPPPRGHRSKPIRRAFPELLPVALESNELPQTQTAGRTRPLPPGRAAKRNRRRMRIARPGLPQQSPKVPVRTYEPNMRFAHRHGSSKNWLKRYNPCAGLYRALTVNKESPGRFHIESTGAGVYLLSENSVR